MFACTNKNHKASLCLNTLFKKLFGAPVTTGLISSLLDKCNDF